MLLNNFPTAILRLTLWHLITDTYQSGVGTLCRHLCERHSCDSLPDSNDLFHLHCSNSEFTTILACNHCQNFEYSSLWRPYDLINNDERQIIVNAELMLICKKGQGVCHFLCCLYRRPILCLCITTSKFLSNYLTYMIESSWCSFDTDFRNGAGSMSLSLLPIEVAKILSMYVLNQLPLSLTRLGNQWLFMLYCHSFLEWGKEHLFRFLIIQVANTFKINDDLPKPKFCNYH